MAKPFLATSRTAEMAKMNTEVIPSSQFSDAQKRSLRRASAFQAAGHDLPDEDEDGVSHPSEESIAHLVHRLHEARRMVPVSVRLDPQVLDWLHSKGEGHLERINAILMGSMEADRRAGAGD